MSTPRLFSLLFVGALALAAILTAAKTVMDFRAPTLDISASPVSRTQILDREGEALMATYVNRWNLYQRVSLHEIPLLLRAAVIEAEDKRFFDHGGPDWVARFHALFENLKAGHAVRGASTITEQVVRMHNLRPRTLWSRWLEGWEARALEQRYSKADILAFYLNQAPYAGQRRGVAQAARYYFGRTLNTLSTKEMLALAVLLRSPNRLDPSRTPAALDARIDVLVQRLARMDVLDAGSAEMLHVQSLVAGKTLAIGVDARHFLRRVRADIENPKAHAINPSTAGLRTSLSADLQRFLDALLKERLKKLEAYGVYDAAALVVDHQRNEILAWINVRAGESASHFDAVTLARQPGSSLKPFVYAMALEKGWTIATRITDEPLDTFLVGGTHPFRNYSGHFYGPVSLREALGNSLNIPAIRTLQFVGVGSMLVNLRALGFTSLDRDADFYGDGLALGNGEVSLFELVGAYSVLARGGVYRPFSEQLDDGVWRGRERRVLSRRTAETIAGILADSDARNLEFDPGLFDFPVDTAIKTGTSNDFRDAWALGFNGRFSAGIWMGNIDGTATHGVSGSIGPALPLRAVFARLGDEYGSYPSIGPDTLAADHDVAVRSTPEPQTSVPQADKVRIFHPQDGLKLALDPRIPADRQAYSLEVPEQVKPVKIEWWLNEQLEATTGPDVTRCVWPIKRGQYSVMARVWLAEGAKPVRTETVHFRVY